MDSIQSRLTPTERQELFRQFKSAMRVEANKIHRTSRIYESQLRQLQRLQSRQRGIHGDVPPGDYKAETEGLLLRRAKVTHSDLSI